MSTALVMVETLEVLNLYGDSPARIVWPNGDISYAPIVGDERGGARLVNVVNVGDPPAQEFYHKSAVSAALSGDTLTYTQTWEADELASVQDVLLQRIDMAAETSRLQYITNGSGQALIYYAKSAEAKAYQTDQNPDPKNYPLLSASVSDGGDLAGVAKDVLDKTAAWTAIGAAIEAVRLPAKAAVQAATAVDAAAAIVSALVWP